MKLDDQWLGQLNALAQRYNQPEFVNYVLEACRKRRAFLFAATDGWVVLEPRVYPVRHVFVLAAWCKGGNAIARYEPVLFDFAQSIGIDTLRFEAPRAGYNKVMPKRGWEKLADGKTWEKCDGRRRR